MRLRDEKAGYDYIYTHVDDFKIATKDPTIWSDRIASIFLTKEHGPRSYQLGNDYNYHDGENMWTYGVQAYTNEAVSHVERIYGYLSKNSTPIPVAYCHPELYDTSLLELNDHRKFQILLEILQWMVTIGKPELWQVVSSLNYFGAFPREDPLDLAVRYFGYVTTVGLHEKMTKIESEQYKESVTEKHSCIKIWM